MSRFPLRRLGDHLQPVGKWNPDNFETGQTFAYIDISAIDQQMKEIREPQVIPVEEAPSRARQIVRADDVLVSTVRPNLNAVASVPDHLDGVIASTGFTVLRPQTESLDHRYLHHWVRSNGFVTYLVSRATGASYPAVSDAIVKDARIPLPAIDEQRRIAAILDKADAIRRKRQQALALADDFLRSAYLEICGDPIANPCGWPTVPLETLIDSLRPITYGILMPGQDQPEGVPYIRVVDMNDGTIKLEQVRRTTNGIANEYKRSTLKSGDVLISIRGHVGRLAIVPPVLDGANITQDTARLAVNEGIICPHYLLRCLESASMQAYMRRFVRGAAVKGLNLGDLKQLPIPVPPSDRQARFTQLSGAHLAKKGRQRKSVDEAANLFASLSQRAFRGEL